VSLPLTIRDYDDHLWAPYGCFKKVSYTSLQRKHQFKDTPKLKSYDGESLDLGNFAMNLETKVPTNDKRLDLSEFHKDICRFRG
jgi:hypothetical protein